MDDSTDITIFDGAVRLPEDYLKTITVLRLDESGKGHPALKHPVSGVFGPYRP